MDVYFGEAVCVEVANISATALPGAIVAFVSQEYDNATTKLLEKSNAGTATRTLKTDEPGQIRTGDLLDVNEALYR